MKLSERGVLALFYCQRYGLLTVEQLAFIASCSVSTARATFNDLGAYVDSFGNVGLIGKGKAPKVYHITQKGYEALKRDGEIPLKLIGKFRRSKGASKWSAKMFHRIQTVDVMLSVEKSIAKYGRLDVVKTFIEYRREQVDGVYTPETTDKLGAYNITPDGAFILENEDDEKFLFFVEVDRGTERITTKIAGMKSYTLKSKLSKYDEYLNSGLFAKKYKKYGEFNYFTLLFITTSDERVDNIKKSASDLPSELHDYYYFSTFKKINSNNLFSKIWQNRNPDNLSNHELIKDN